MPSKEYEALVEKVAMAIMHDENTYRVGGEEYCETVARIAIATILPIIAAHLSRQPSFGDGKWAARHVLSLAASALGEQSE